VLVARDLKVKYKQSLLGPVWLVLQPVALLLAFIVGFHTVAHVTTQGVPYALFALTGLSVWSYFSAASAAGAISLIGNTNLVRFTACPRHLLTIASLAASLPALLVPAAASVVAAAITGHLSPHLVIAPLLAAWLFTLTASFTALLAALAVRYHDIPAALPFILQVGVFFAPIAYPLTRLSPDLRTLVAINPLTGLTETWRWALLGTPADAWAVGLALGITAALCVMGWRVFGRIEVTMADEI
jgi:ABC-type polysaccharide/polyol phosphate export permease